MSVASCADVKRHKEIATSTADRVEGNWKQVKGKVPPWELPPDDDLDKIAGRRDQLEGKIQERYGIAKDQVKKDVDDWSNAQSW